ncbi:MAG: Gfo/Idh/MocA family oxidoreductase [Deinococcota bacterium]
MTINIGVVGLKFGHYHVQTLANLPGVRLVAVADRSAELPKGLDAYAHSYGATAYRDGLELLDHPELDAVSICTSPRSRAPLIEAAAARDLPMFIEKPWAANLIQAHSLTKLAQTHNANIMLGFSFRVHPAAVRLQDLVRDELDTGLGRGMLLTGEYLFDWLPEADNWLWDKNNGGGFFNENSCHLLDMVCALLGKPISVFAKGVNEHASPSAEAALVTITFEGGALASVLLGGLGAGAHKNYPRLTLITQNGQATLHGREHIWESLIWATRNDEVTHTLTTSPEALGQTRYSHALSHFVDCVQTGKPFAATVDDGLRAVKLATAIYASIDNGQEISLEEL